MNQKFITLGILITIIILALGGGFYFLNSNNNSLQEESMDSMTKSTDEEGSDEMMDKNSQMEGSSSKYVEYSNSNFANSDGRRVLFFYANWCPTCRPVDEELNTNMNKIPDGVKVIRVNYNDPYTDESEKELARKYGVTYQHTFVQIDEDGNEITKWNGGGLTEILDRLN